MNYMNRMNLKTIQFRLFTPKKLNKTGKPILFSMKLGKLLVLVIFAMTVLVSVPHVSVLGLEIGSEKVYAASVTTFPSSSMPVSAWCSGSFLRLGTPLGDMYRCAWDNTQNKFTIVQCGWAGSGYVWTKLAEPISDSSYETCKVNCEARAKIGCPTIKSTCAEPSVTLTGPTGNVMRGPPYIDVVSNVNYPDVGQIRSNVIHFGVTLPNGGTDTKPARSCSSQTCTDSSNYYNYTDGTVITYWSEVRLSDGTLIFNPKHPTCTYSTCPEAYKFSISSSSTTGGMTANPSSLSIVDGQTATSTISGGTSPYIALTSNSNIITATVSGSIITIKGISLGSATVTAKDS